MFRQHRFSRSSFDSRCLAKSPPFRNGRDGTAGPTRRTAFRRGADEAVDVSAVFVCLGDDPLGMLAALTMHEFLRASDVPVIVRLSEESGFAAALATDEILARAILQGYVRHHLAPGEKTDQNRSLVMWEQLRGDAVHSGKGGL